MFAGILMITKVIIVAVRQHFLSPVSFPPVSCIPPAGSHLSGQREAPDTFVPGVPYGCLAVTYFHMGIHTIIGAGSFHGPVRDGKAWDQPAMAARLKLYKLKSRYEVFSAAPLIYSLTNIQQCIGDEVSSSVSFALMLCFRLLRFRFKVLQMIESSLTSN